VLVAGRWFRASRTEGPWEFVAANALPADFPKIPDDSPKENVKASVAGTAQAKEAAIEADVPQTAAIKKSETRMTPPAVDGQPGLEPIGGTPIRYVANTAAPIIEVDGKSFFAVENRVWFDATTVDGQWAVASSVPAIIYTIPPASPLYYVTFVKIDAATADTMVVGYTPGCHGTCIDPVTGVVVFGTGYPYAPWVGSVWYGPPVTYGFGVSIRYTPWTGWTFGFGVGWS
jgi:hypothetical protein